MQNKVCNICNIEKSLDNFGFTDKLKTKRDPRCKSCQAKRRREFHRSRVNSGLCYYCGNKRMSGRSICQECFQKRRDQRNLFKTKAIQYLGGKCERCGLETPYFAVYDFHHIDFATKEATIGEFCSNFKNSKQFEVAWQKMKIELDKCNLLCSNCHRILHFEAENLGLIREEVNNGEKS